MIKIVCAVKILKMRPSECVLMLKQKNLSAVAAF